MSAAKWCCLRGGEQHHDLASRVPEKGRIPELFFSRKAKNKKEAERRVCVALCIELDKLRLIRSCKKKTHAGEPSADGECFIALRMLSFHPYPLSALPCLHAWTPVWRISVSQCPTEIVFDLQSSRQASCMRHNQDNGIGLRASAMVCTISFSLFCLFSSQTPYVNWCGHMKKIHPCPFLSLIRTI